jgi:hypothetical protein
VQDSNSDLSAQPELRATFLPPVPTKSAQTDDLASTLAMSSTTEKLPSEPGHHSVVESSPLVLTNSSASDDVKADQAGEGDKPQVSSLSSSPIDVKVDQAGDGDKPQVSSLSSSPIDVKVDQAGDGDKLLSSNTETSPPASTTSSTAEDLPQLAVLSSTSVNVKKNRRSDDEPRDPIFSFIVDRKYSLKQFKNGVSVTLI